LKNQKTKKKKSKTKPKKKPSDFTRALAKAELRITEGVNDSLVELEKEQAIEWAFRVHKAIHSEDAIAFLNSPDKSGWKIGHDGIPKRRNAT